MFDTVMSLLSRWLTLRQLNAMEKRQSRELSHIFYEEVALARSFLDQGATDKAIRIWRELRVRFHDLSIRPGKGFYLVLDLGLYDEVEILIREGRSRYPGGEAHFAEYHAQVALLRGNIEEAQHRCEIILRNFPRRPEGYKLTASCLTGIGRTGEAENIIGLGISKVPSDLSLRCHYAQYAEQRHEWETALERWRAAWNTSMEQASPLVSQARCLKELGRYAEANTILNHACELFQTDCWAFREKALLAEAAGALNKAVEHWNTTLRRFPSFALAYLEAVKVFRKAGINKEADELLRTAAIRFPRELAINLEYARSAHSERDWAAATQRWAFIREHFPDNVEAQVKEAVALAALIHKDCE